MFENNFSLWCDYIERDFLDTTFKDLIKNGVINGATSNPAIFQSAFKSSIYKSDIEKLKDKNAKEIYENLALSDILKAANILKPLYESSNDGFISIEVDPMLCDDSEGTYSEGMSIYERLNMPNVMIKVPATNAGFIAMKKLVKNGVNVNSTLIFSPTQAKKSLEAFEEISTNTNTKAVISIFVSRFDRKLDELLSEKGKVGIYNATKIYNIIESVNNKNVRALFASTGVKDDVYKPTYYIDELLYKNSINTAPLETIKAFIKEPKSELKHPIAEYEIERFFNELKEIIDIEIVYNGLLTEGLDSFKKSFQDILSSLK